MMRLVLLTVLISSALGCGWDPLGICKGAKSAIKKEIRGLKDVTEDVKEAALNVTDHFFDQLNDTFANVESAVLRIESTLKNDTEALVNFTLTEVKQVTDQIIDKLEELVGKSVKEVTAALDHIIQAATKLEQDIFSRTTSIMHQFESFVWQALCTTQGIISQLQIFIAGMPGGGHSNKDDCDCLHEAAVFAADTCTTGCNCQHSIITGDYKCPCSLASWATTEDQNAFYAIRCKALKEIDTGLKQNRSLDWVVSKLGSIKDLGEKLHCYHWKTPSIGDWYATQVLNLNEQIYVLQHPFEQRAVAPVAISAPGAGVAEDSSKLALLVERQGAMLEQQGIAIAALQAEVTALKRLPVPRIVPQQRRLTQGCGTALECWTEALEQLEQAEALVNTVLNKTEQAEKDLDAAKTAFEHKYDGEIKVFNMDSCPDGWKEVEAMKGYLLVGRPQDGTTGTVINGALTKDEKCRVGPHGHDVSVSDNGHGHGVHDPGHSHQFSFGGGHKTSQGLPRDGNPGSNFKFEANVGGSQTSISVETAKANIAVSVKDTSSEGYPLAYVLLCQRVAMPEPFQI